MTMHTNPNTTPAANTPGFGNRRIHKKQVITAVAVILVVALIIALAFGLKGIKSKSADAMAEGNSTTTCCCEYHCDQCGTLIEENGELKPVFCCEKCDKMKGIVINNSGNMVFGDVELGDNAKFNQIIAGGDLSQILQESGNNSNAGSAQNSTNSGNNQGSSNSNSNRGGSQPEPGTTRNCRPVEVPTEAPTRGETPSEKPTERPTEKPTEKPTERPTEKPTEAPKAKVSVMFQENDTNGTRYHTVSIKFSGNPENLKLTATRGSVRKINDTLYRWTFEAPEGETGRVTISVSGSNVEAATYRVNF